MTFKILKKSLASLALAIFVVSSGLMGSIAFASSGSGGGQDRWWEYRRPSREEARESRREEREERERIRDLDRDRRYRYRLENRSRVMGYYDRAGEFHRVGFYDRWGYFHREPQQ